jgi:hypothetical protein
MISKTKFNNQIIYVMKNRTTSISLGLLVFLVVGFTSCSKKLSQEEIVRKNAEEYIKEKMNDPSSYEFVKLELIDTITFNDNIEYIKIDISSDIDINQSSIERNEEYKTSVPSLYNEKEVEELKSKIDRNKIILKKIDSLATLLGDRRQEIASYTYVLTFRGNNAMGVKILNEYVVQTGQAPEFEILNMTNEKDEILFTPNYFPGYLEMFEQD